MNENEKKTTEYNVPDAYIIQFRCVDKFFAMIGEICSRKEEILVEFAIDVFKSSLSQFSYISSYFCFG